jgi:hypothetical protein
MRRTDVGRGLSFAQQAKGVAYPVFAWPQKKIVVCSCICAKACYIKPMPRGIHYP